MLTWDAPNERFFQQGIDRGVLYAATAVAWNGLTGVDEGEQGSTSILYRDGTIYLADADASDFSGKLTALFFPDAFSECVGIPAATDGLYVDNQKPKRFGLSYRTLIGQGGNADPFGYQIHLLYNVFATIAPRSRRSLGSDNAPVEFSFDLVATPVRLPGFRPSAHYIIDTRTLGKSVIDQLEGILYGASEAPRLPTPQELYDLMNFGDSIIVTDHQDGTLTISGSYANVHMISSTEAEIKNINAVVNPDGTIVISDGGNTTIVTD